MKEERISVENSAASALASLAELQQLDRARREKQLQIAALESEIAALDADVDKRRRDLDLAREQLDAAEARRRELESFLDVEGGKMKDRRMRLNRVRNERELLALRHEIEVGKEQNQQVEEEVLQLLEKIESLTAAFRVVEEGFNQSESAARERRETNQAQLVALRDEIEQAAAGRQRVAQSLDRTLLLSYEKIFERRGGMAVAEVRNGICLGCRMSLPPQLYNELQKKPEVRLCPSCHRILHWRPERMEDAE